MNIDVIEPSGRISLPHQSLRITSILHSQTGKLFAGLSNGNLLVLKASIPVRATSKSTVNDEKAHFAIESTFKRVCRNNLPIEKIVGIRMPAEFRDVLAISTSDSIMVFEVAGNNLSFIQDLPQSSSVTFADVFEMSRGQLFVFTSKKTLMVFEIQQSDSNPLFQKVAELAFKEKAHAVQIFPLKKNSRRYLLVALTNEVLLLDTKDFQTRKLSIDENSMYSFTHNTSFSYFSLGSSEPSTWIIHVSNTRALLVKDTLVMILDVDDDDQLSLTQSSIKFSSVPLHVIFLYPLYLLVVYNKKIDIIDHTTGDCIQRFLHTINSNLLILTRHNNVISIASTTGTNSIHQFRILGFQKQIEQFLSISGKGSFSSNVKDPRNDLKVVGLNKSISLVKLIDPSDQFFKQDNGEGLSTANKRKQLILREFHRKKTLILFESYSKYHESLVEIASEWIVNYRDVLSLFPDFLNGEIRIASKGENPLPDAESVSMRSFSHNAVKRVSLDDFIVTKANPSDSGTDMDNGDGTKSIGIDANGTESADGSKLGFLKTQNVRKLFKAVNQLIIYLTDQRRLHLAFTSGENATISWKGVEISAFDIYPFLTAEGFNSQIYHIASVIDTSLFLCYFYTKPMMLGPLLRLPNNLCNAKVVNECLLDGIKSSNHKLNELQLHQQTNFTKELLDFYFGRGLHKDALEMLYKLSHSDEELKDASTKDLEFLNFVKGPSLTVQYLTKLSNNQLDLIFEFSYWVIGEADDLAVSMSMTEQIFMNDSYECENYDNNKVLNFIQNVLKSDDIAIRYLEWLSTEVDISKKLAENKSLSKFHTRLCLLYLQKLKQFELSHPHISEDEFCQDEYYNKLYNFLKTRDIYEPWTLLKNIPTSKDGFLRLTVFIYKRLGEHEKSVDVLYNQLNDLDSAMEYCSQIYYQPKSKKLGENLLHKLLEDLLMGWEDGLESIERLLALQGSKMSMNRVLKSLPDTFPLCRLSRFLFDNLREMQGSLHDRRFASLLYQVGNFKLQGQIWDKQAENCTIESSKQLCPECYKPLGYGIFSVSNSNRVLHYGCYQRLQNLENPKKESSS